MWPILLQYVDQHQVEFVQKGTLPAHSCFIGRYTDDEIGKVGANASALVVREGTPPGFDDALHDLKRKELGLLVFGLF